MALQVLPKRILALDPALSCGFAHTDGQFGVWNLQSMEQRLVRIRQHIHQAFEDWGFDELASEEASFGSVNPDQQAKHNETLGVIRLCARELRLGPVVTYKPMIIKLYATGHGFATKAQMVRACETMLGIELRPEQHDIADAIWILHMAQRGYVHVPTSKPRKRRGRRKAEKGLF